MTGRDALQRETWVKGTVGNVSARVFSEPGLRPAEHQLHSHMFSAVLSWIFCSHFSYIYILFLPMLSGALTDAGSRAGRAAVVSEALAVIFCSWFYTLTTIIKQFKL